MQKKDNRLAEKRQLRALFVGHVQGVGFRYTTQSLARRYDVKGYVRNLTDGGVEIIAEGDEAEVRAFFDSVRTSRLCDHIREVKEVWSGAQGIFKSFEIAV